MNNIKEYNFSDLYEMGSGISSKPEQAGHGAPFVSFSTVFNNYFLPEKVRDLMDTSKDEQEVYSVKGGDILLTRTSETIDELGMSCVVLEDYPRATFSGFVKRLRPTQSHVTYPKFMGFYLRSKFFRKTMTNNAVLTLRASLNEDIFSYLKLYLPDYDTQKKIGDFLYSLTAKIELNNRINAELEAMAKTIYDYWFVQFDFPDKKGKPYKASGGKMVWNEELKREIPEGWEVDKLSSKLKIASGFPFDSDTYVNNGKYKVITIKNVQDGKLDSAKVDFVNEIPKRLPDWVKLSDGDVLISLTGNVGRICLVAEENLLLNQRVGKFICAPSTIAFFYFMFQRRDTQSKLEKLATGTSQKNLSPVDTGAMKVLFPGNDILEKFDEIVKSSINKIISNHKENQKLTELRDWLLPMLMNGQIKIKDAEQELAMAAEPHEEYKRK